VRTIRLPAQAGDCPGRFPGRAGSLTGALLRRPPSALPPTAPHGQGLAYLREPHARPICEADRAESAMGNYKLGLRSDLV